MICQNIKNLIFWYFAIFQNFSKLLDTMQCPLLDLWYRMNVSDPNKDLKLKNMISRTYQNGNYSLPMNVKFPNLASMIILWWMLLKNRPKSWKIAKYQNIKFLIFWYITKLKGDFQKIISHRFLESSTEWYKLKIISKNSLTKKSKKGDSPNYEIILTWK